eukprot:m.12084 g.12084  ORF g.12084 m.12084 type:complete len:220 (+) comp3951_c0_seq1:132-791(+)
MFEEGKSISKEEHEAYLNDLRKEHEQACDQFKKASDCHMLAEFYQSVDKDFGKANQWYKKLCDEKNYGRSCLGYAMALLSGQAVERDPAQGFRYLKKACSLGNTAACHNIGMILQSDKFEEFGIKQDGKEALKMFENGCQQDFRNGCFMASIMYLTGRGGVKKNMPKALDYAEKACELQHTWGCINAVKMLETGDGVPKDLDKAQKLRERAKELVESEN